MIPRNSKTLFSLTVEVAGVVAERGAEEKRG